MKRTLILVTNGETRAIFDETGKLIYDQDRSGDETFLLRALAENFGLNFKAISVPEEDDFDPSRFKFMI